jgi:hypothetical protein
MSHEVIIHPEFKAELLRFDVKLRDVILAYVKLIAQFGPTLGRPYSDTLKSKKYKNLKELRLTTVTGEWRVSYAFDPERKAVLLMGASKSGVSQKLFYNKLITLSEERYTRHLERIKFNA